MFGSGESQRVCESEEEEKAMRRRRNHEELAKSRV